MNEIDLSGYDDNEDHTRDSVPRPRRAASRVRARRRRPILERPRGAPDQRRRRLPRGPPARRTVSLAIATTTIKCFGLMIGLQVARSCCQGYPSYQ